MKINPNNYEAFVLDHAEGRLTPEQSLLLKAHIHRHPELGEWDDLTSPLPQFIPDEVFFASKNDLLQSGALPSSETLSPEMEALFVSFYEGQSTAAEQKEIDTFLENNPAYQKDFQLFGKVFLRPEPGIRFPDKQKLLQKAPLFMLNRFGTVAVAASLALLLGWGWWWQNQQQSPITSPPAIAEMTPSADVTTTAPIPKIEMKSAESVEDLSITSSLPVVQQHQPMKTAIYTHEKATALPVLQSRIHTKILSLAASEPLELREKNGIEERLALAAIFEGMAQTNQTSPPSATERIINKVVNDALNGVNPAFAETMAENNTSQQESSLWELAQKGIQTFNFLTDNDVQLVRVDDAFNNKKSVRLVSNIINYSRSSTSDDLGKAKM